MNTRAFLISAAASASLQILYYAAVFVVVLVVLPPVFGTMMQEFPSSGNPPPGFFNFMGINSLMLGVGVLLAPVVYAGTGALYVWLHRRAEQPVTAEQGAIGGAVAAFTARFAAGLVVALGSLLVGQVMIQMMGEARGLMPVPGPLYWLINSLSSVVGGLLNACLGSVFAAALGGLGGALTSALLK